MPALARSHLNIMERNREIIGDWLRELRMERGYGQQQLIDLCGGSWVSSWSEIERGQKNLPPAIWADIAHVLGVPQDQFAKKMLRHTNPWAYAMLYGWTLALRAEVAEIPDKYAPARRPSAHD